MKSKKTIGVIIATLITVGSTWKVIHSQSQKIASELVEESTKSIVSDSILVLRIEIKDMFVDQRDHSDKQFSNLLNILQRANPRFKKAAFEKLKEDKDNAVLKEALKPN